VKRFIFLLLFVSSAGHLIAQPNITSAEYFFDSDPGFGQGIAINVNPDATIQISNLEIPYELVSGFHKLYIRVSVSINENTEWGMASVRTVFIEESSAIRPINAAEYFIDSDPGIGNATPIDIGSPSDNIAALLTNIESELSVGFHKLYIRTRYDDGTWGFATTRQFYIEASAQIRFVNAAEYFFDADPGFGQGNSIVVNTPGNEFSEVLTNIGEGLIPGFHKLYIRTQYDDGVWGLATGRTVFVEPSLVTRVVDAAEYFLDNDPGVGQGVPIANITPSNEISGAFEIETNGLVEGVHKLYIRLKYDDGTWGLAQRRVVNVTKLPSLNPKIIAYEYYYDNDPGVGLANATVVDSAAFDVLGQTISAASSNLEEGVHKLFIRVQDEMGNWGFSQFSPFEVVVQGRALDSAVLVMMYDVLQGENWINQTNWLSESTTIDQWYGIGLNEEGRVDSINLSASGLLGSLPPDIGQLEGLRYLNLSSNSLSDTVPVSFTNLIALEKLILNDNQFNGLPDLSEIASLNSLSLDSNFFNFKDLETNISVTGLSYSNQGFVDIDTINIELNTGDNFELLRVIPGDNNVYRWYLNEVELEGNPQTEYQLINATAADSGTYSVRITNSLVPNLEFLSVPYYVNVLPPAEPENMLASDSLALVSLYNSLSGGSWSNKNNWLVGSADTWFGVTMENRRLIRLDLSNNNLIGDVSDSLLLATGLRQLLLNNNRITGLPDLSSLSNLNFVNVSLNKLQFGDLESIASIQDFNYSPQDSVTQYNLRIVEFNSSQQLELNVSGSNNSYTWYNNGELLEEEVFSTLSRENIQFEDAGLYRAEIRNNTLPQLVLTSGIFDLRVTSLSRDSLALLAVYQQSLDEGGRALLNWNTAPINQWTGVTVASERVSALSLAGIGLKGNLPEKLLEMTGLVSINISNNLIIGTPALGNLPLLSFLDIRNNNLEIDDLEKIVDVEGIQFNPQRQLPVEQALISVRHLSPVILQVITAGAQNEYQWLRNEGTIANATNSIFEINAIDFETMGIYSLQVTSSIIRAKDQNFRLVSQPQTLLAYATLSGSILGIDNSPLAEGEVDALNIIPGQSAYDTAQTEMVLAGQFSFDSLILGNYIFLTRSEDTVYIPTYYSNTEDWITAETVQLRSDEQLNDYEMVFRPRPLTEADGEAGIAMTVESDLEGDDDSRIEDRRRVRKAGCSLRRRTTGAGRPTDEEFVLIAYKETDDNGEVNFGFLPTGVYRLNIQYPGIPMDPDSFVEFEIEEGKEDTQLTLEAVVTEDGIVVTLVNVLSTFRKYFKNLNVYPNPVADQLNINYDRLLSKDVRMRLVDVQGKQVIDMAIEKGYQQQLELNVQSLKPGMYYLYFYDATSSKQQLVTVKLIVQH